MTTAKRQIFIAVVAIGLGSTSAPAHAQPANTPVVIEGDDKPWSQGVPVAERQAALEQFNKGNQLFEIPLLARAAEKYRAALTHWKHPSIYFNLALAQLSLGEEVDAHANFELALKYGEGPLGAEWFQTAQQKLAQLEQELGRIRIACSTRGAEVTLDGITLFTCPDSHEIWAKAAPHEVTARKPEYLSQARRVTVEPGQVTSLELNLVTLSEVAENGRRWAPWKPWAVIGAGTVGAAASGVLHAASRSSFRAYDDGFLRSCPMGCAPGAIEPRLNDQLSLATREQELAVTGYLVSGSIIATGVVLLYLNRPRLIEQDTTTTSTMRVALAPTFSTGEWGVALTVSR